MNTNYEEFGNQIFSKKKQIRFKYDSYTLPPTSQFYRDTKWEIHHLMLLKDRLNNTKDNLNQLNLKEWHKHTRFLNCAGLIQPYIRKTYSPEFCSNAWCKFTECLYSYDVVPKAISELYDQVECKNKVSLNSLHLCEAPGAFISATNHFLSNNMPGIGWDWVGTTLSPYYEGNWGGHMINDDSLILSSAEKWTFLKDSTGNLMRSQNISHLVHGHLSNFKPHFVSADGSIDCQTDPGEQENKVTKLHLAEIITALFALSTGGSFVLKIFTFFECQAICHLYLLSCAFKEINLFKPATSREGNSEIYVICTEYLGRDKIESELNELLKYLENEEAGVNRALFPLDAISSAFIEKISLAAHFFAECQTQDPFLAFYNMIIRPINEQVCANFNRLYPIKMLDKKNALFPHSDKRGISFHIDQRFEDLSYEDMISVKNLNLVDFLAYVQDELKIYIPQRPRINSFVISKQIKNYWAICNLINEVGRPYETIKSSRFVVGKIFDFRDRIRESLKKYYSSFIKFYNNNLIATIPQHYCDQYSAHKVLYHIRGVTNLHQSELSYIKIICFDTKLQDFLTKSDFYFVYEKISELIYTILKLKKGESLFLCSFPLITRLHVSLLFGILKLLFHQTTVFYNLSVSKNESVPIGMHGVLLHSFLGFDEQLELKELERDLIHISFKFEGYLKEFDSGAIIDEAILNLVPIKYLLDLCSDNLKKISFYNQYHLSVNLISTAQSAQEFLRHQNVQT